MLNTNNLFSNEDSKFLAVNKKVKQLEKKVATLLLQKHEPIAIIGIGLDLPGDNQSLGDFTEFLRKGKDGICTVPEDRWSVEEFYSSDTTEKGKVHTSYGGYLKDIRQFDPLFFNISPKEAPYIDPQQRLVLRTAWKALEHANIDSTSYKYQDGGVYVGVSSMDYTLEVSSIPYEELKAYVGTGTAHSAVSGRASFFLGWHGPCISVDTACSSSLVALHQAVEGLRRRECNIALCGGVNAIHHPRNLIVFSQAKMLSPDGRCKTFDDRADGYGRSEGCGFVVLKRLSDALEDNDNIIALVRGVATRQDGKSGGLTVPNGRSQAEVMNAALSNSRVKPEQIQYVEAHGTGTSLGDPIEIGAINEVFGKLKTDDNPLIVGSLKANIGHMEAAAGVGGIIKVALQLQHKEIFPHINIETPSTKIPWEQYNIHIPSTLGTWDDTSVPRAIVNSFGFSGTICSAVLEAAPKINDLAEASSTVSPSEATPFIFTVSAKTKDSLNGVISQYIEKLASDPAIDISDLCHTSNTGRVHFPHRFAVAVDTVDALQRSLSEYERQLSTTQAEKSRVDKIAFLFTGQGAQYSGMGYELYNHFECFQQAVDKCDRLFFEHLSLSIRDLMFDESETAREKLYQTEFTQPALFTLEFALSRLIHNWGIRPSVVLGHSIGEIVAATVAGLFTLPDAVNIVSTRARLMQSVSTPGGMFAVKDKAGNVLPLTEGLENISLAAINTPSQCVISGAEPALEVFAKRLKTKEIDYVRLPVSHAFHSPLMQEVYNQFKAVLEKVKFYPPKVSLISNLTGKVASYEELSNPDYWVRQIGEAVLFADCIKTLDQRGSHVFLELGPKPTLTKLAKLTVKQEQHVWATCLNKDSKDTDSITHALVNLYEAGFNPTWDNYYLKQSKKLELPHYVFDEKNYWLPVKHRHKRAATTFGDHPLLGTRVNEAAPEKWTFNQMIDAKSPSYLADHVVMQQVVFPAAAYMEMLIALQDKLHGEFSGQIANVAISQPLFLSEEPVRLSTEAVQDEYRVVHVKISSYITSANKNIERIHVTADLLPASEDTSSIKSCQQSLQEIAVASTMVEDKLDEHNISRDNIYDRFESLGLSYGPEFRRIESIQRINENSVMGRLSTEMSTESENLPPSVLDCAMQCLIGLVNDEENLTYLPVSFERLQFHKKPRGKLTVLMQLQPSHTSHSNDVDLVINMLLLDDDRPVLTVSGIGLKQVKNTAAMQRQLFHKPIWVKSSLTKVKVSQEELKPHHVAVMGVNEAALFNYSNELKHAAIKLTCVESVEQMLELMTTDNTVDGICYVWQNFPDRKGINTLSTSCQNNYQALLALVKSVASASFVRQDLRLWLVSEGGQWLHEDKIEAVDVDSMAASTLWGFGHVLLNEESKLKTTLIDLPARRSEAERCCKGLVEELMAWDTGSNDYQIAYRESGRHVRRIIPVQAQDREQNFEIQINKYGLFENIAPVRINEPQPLDDQLQVEVRSAGLNFKDVLNALGLLKQYADESGNEYQPLPLGFEASGIVVDRGERSQYQIGDEVMFSYLGCMKKRVTVPSIAVVKKPTNINFDQAAALATAYITAYYSLHNLANIKAGDRVLIHAAAGGVGQAAVQLAHAAGAEVFATASPYKWSHLKAQGVKHIMNSRTLEFANEIDWLTDGEGVDIVLNSLNKDYIPVNLSCLANGGRFVELGKLGIWSQEQIQQEREDVKYHSFDLSEFPEAELYQLNHDILDKIGSMIEAKQILPLPTTAYNLTEINEAFSLLSRGANIGKLVLRFTEEQTASQPFAIDDHHCYLITGGYGALGQVLVNKLVARGARHLALISRTLSESMIQEMTNNLGTEVKLYHLQGDISNPDDVSRVFTELSHISVPLGAIFHAAGILSDAPITKQDLNSFSKVLAAKVQGTFLLHEASRSLPDPPTFVGFSSIASVLGPVSQSNYAAANSFIDHLMNFRAAMGLPGISINWGPWGEIGMAARLSKRIVKSIENKGIKFLSPRQALQSMLLCMDFSDSQIMICEFDWNRYVSGLTVPNSLYERLVNTNDTDSLTLSLKSLDSMPSTERRNTVLEFLRAKVTRVLQIDNIEQVNLDANFSDLGLDSLVAVELKNSLEASFSVSLSSSLVYDYPSLPMLADYLISQLDGAKSSANVPDKSIDEMDDKEVSDELTAITEAI